PHGGPAAREPRSNRASRVLIDWRPAPLESRDTGLDARTSGPSRGLGASRGSRSAKAARPAALGDVAELLGLSERLELLQRLVLDLADPLAGDVERPPHLVEGAGVLATQAVAELEHAALAVAQVLQRLAKRFLGQNLGRALIR